MPSMVWSGVSVVLPVVIAAVHAAELNQQPEPRGTHDRQDALYKENPPSFILGREQLQQNLRAAELVDEYLQDATQAAPKLHVVYVSPKDRPVPSDYRQRLQRCILHLQNFFAGQMSAHGFGKKTFKLDTDARGDLKIHQVELDQSLEQIERYAAGRITRDAAFAALKKAGIDAQLNHVLIVCNMPDGISPFVGQRTQNGGVAWICDLPHLDTLNMQSRHFGNFKHSRLMGEDVCTYLGGAALELGRSFGLRNNNLGGTERQNGKSLMGDGFNSYGGKLRGLQQDCVLAGVDALQLNSLPLFNAKSKPSAQNATGMLDFEEFSVESLPQGLMIYGKINTTPRCYALSLRITPADKSDYASRAAATVLQPDGSFSLALQYPDLAGVFKLSISAMLVDGQVVEQQLFMQVKADGTVDVAALQDLGMFGDVYRAWRQQKSSQALQILEKLRKQPATAGSAQFNAALQRWQACLQGGSKPSLHPAKIDPQVRQVSLVDCLSGEIASGWSKPMFDCLPPNPQGSQAWFSQGPLKRFIFLHAPGKVQYLLGAKWKSLRARLGLALGANGSVAFEVYADGRKMFATQKLGPGQSVELELDIEEVEKLELRALDAGDGNSADWAVIGDPVLLR